MLEDKKWIKIRKEKNDQRQNDRRKNEEKKKIDGRKDRERERKMIEEKTNRIRKYITQYSQKRKCVFVISDNKINAIHIKP